MGCGWSLVVMGVVGVGVGVFAGVWLGVLCFAQGAAAFWAAEHVSDVVFSFFRERMFRRDRLLVEYVPVRVGSVWLAVGFLSLWVWASYGFGVLLGAPWGLVCGWVVPACVGLTVVAWVRARRATKAFRADVVAARDVSLDERFWAIVKDE